MLVDVVLMRHRGEKIARELLDTAPKTRGHLAVWRYLDHVRRKHIPVASLNVAPLSHTAQLLPRLDNVRLVRWQDGALVLTGTEIIDRPRKQPDEHYRQSWWVRIVVEPQVTGPTPLANFSNT